MSPEARPQRLLKAFKQAELRIRAAKETATRSAGLSRAQYVVLQTVSADPGVTAAELARRGEVTPQTMSVLLTRMEKAGLIERKPHPRHCGVMEIHPTGDGIARFKAADEQLGQVERRLRDSLSKAEQEQFEELLGRCAGALDTEQAGA
ncbi:MarR family winged helix-turn-helix transcriptional regulator [Streptomyces monticola]|uniref:MarR family winged helix-turn-helix transcriptional regulator n=1 Tax=Streptomyces monticola TaxID=2666263 RepID=A0ABW2JTC7_9ACTN